MSDPVQGENETKKSTTRSEALLHVRNRGALLQRHLTFDTEPRRIKEEDRRKRSESVKVPCVVHAIALHLHIFVPACLLLGSMTLAHETTRTKVDS